MLALFPFQSLLSWYAKNGRSTLPWRELETLSEDTRAYRVWLSEILLQQTQAPRVVDFFNRIIAVYPTVQHLAKASYEEFFPLYQWLGYYSRARNLLATACIITNERDGVFPKGSDELQKLPGVGAYTAEAIRAFAYNIPTLAFDTNLEKVFSRYFYGDRSKKLSKEEKSELITQLEASGVASRDINAALMDFATLVSLNTKTAINYDEYPLPGCKFCATRGELEVTQKKARQVFPIQDASMVAFLSDHTGKVLFSAKQEYAEPFILPPSPDKDHRRAIQTYFLESFGLQVSVRPPFKKALIQDAPFAFYRVRIQTGKANLQSFLQEQFEKWRENFEKTSEN